jgi:TolB-like protein
MKTLSTFLIAVLAMISFTIQAQTSNAPQTKISVLGIDALQMPQDKESLAHLTRLKLQKMDGFVVFRHYDVLDEMKTAGESAEDCLSVKCLARVGELIGAEYMLTGSLENLSDGITVNYNLVSVEEKTIVKSVVKEFYYFPRQIDDMITISLNELFDVETDPLLTESLVMSENVIDQRPIERLNLNGPRMGALFVGGHKGKRMQDNKNVGGYDMLPVMSQFGYQFELQYMAAGGVQALLEFLPMVSGLDQGRFVPSFTFMNGFRHSRSGWEFAFGPTISFNKIAEGYFNDNGDWKLERDFIYWDNEGNYLENPNEIEEDYDSRGRTRFSYGFTLAAGKTFTSGQLNIPVNVFLTPAKNGFHVGTSFGFNVRKKQH